MTNPTCFNCGAALELVRGRYESGDYAEWWACFSCGEVYTLAQVTIPESVIREVDPDGAIYGKREDDET